MLRLAVFDVDVEVDVDVDDEVEIEVDVDADVNRVLYMQREICCDFGHNRQHRYSRAVLYE